MDNKTTDDDITLNISSYDVFALSDKKQFTGNQLAVFSGDGCDALSEKQMQQLATEMNYAESSFLFTNSSANGNGNQKFKYRIFTSESELNFAGHPTLGTAYHALEHFVRKQTSRKRKGEEEEDAEAAQSLTTADSPNKDAVTLETKHGLIIPVWKDPITTGLLWMEQQIPKREPVNDSVNCDMLSGGHLAKLLKC